MIVDYQSHWFSRARFEALLDREPGRYPRTEDRGEDGYLFWFDDEPAGNPWYMRPDYYDLDLQLEDMDANGVDVAVLAPCLIGEVTHLDVGEAREITAWVNEESARAQRELPDRRRCLAMLPMQDIAVAIETLDYAIGRLGLAGVSVITNVNGQRLVTEETAPIFERIAELGVPVVLHPSSRSFVFDHMRSLGRVPDVGLSWMYETSAAALSFIYSGVLDKCPDLTILHPHLGGVLPFLKTRLDLVHGAYWWRGRERGFEEYIRDHFFTDTANLTPGAMDLAVSLYGPDRILFATDHPWIPRKATLAVLDGLDPELAAQIRGNRLTGLALPGD